MSRRITRSTPEVCAIVMDWHTRNMALSAAIESAKETLRILKAERGRSEQWRHLAKRLGVSTYVLAYIIRAQGHMKTHRKDEYDISSSTSRIEVVRPNVRRDGIREIAC